jgi:hypothetical protein
MRKTMIGGVAGLVATLAMSVFFAASERRGRIRTLPPKTIVRHFSSAQPEALSNAAASAAHLAYGVGAGAAFGFVFGRWSRLAPFFGLVIWGVSYEGWVPAMGILPPAHRDQPSRARTILAAHVVYGVTLGIANAYLSRRMSRKQR